MLFLDGCHVTMMRACLLPFLPPPAHCYGKLKWQQRWGELEDTTILTRMNHVDARRRLGEVCIITAHAVHYLDRW